ncbi:MAG: ketoacyl-ACP synthase III [Rhodospirillaceae bacterium]|nr:ketoacyl-ACP synthase III [Rhodospirillaceae bacterium]MDD9999111.1 ketoacyl-ACP synthase III [Rhodospirillaceae bacterium]MDE0360268.1 ketoacyl-ACP synthase III [Rhodospirillaceae bacterium]
MYSRIAGTGAYLPEKVLTNFDLEKMIDTTDEWIRTRTGIERRHIAAKDEATSDLSEQACRAALDAAGLTPADIDLVVVGTCTPDLVFPNVACLLQERMGMSGAAFSIEAACSGFVYSLSVADKFVRAGQATRALVVGAEVMSRIIDWTDRETCVLFGDGAGAVVLEASDDAGILYTDLGADGRYRNLLYADSGVSRVKEEGETTLLMKGNEVFKVAVRTLEGMVDRVLEDNGLEQGEIDWFVPHQANLRIIRATARRLGLPIERVVLTVRDHGNTSAASIPMALDTAVRDGRIQPGDLVLMEAFGGGFTWGATLVRY